MPDAKAELIDELTSHFVWYEKYSSRSAVLFNALSMAVVVLSMVTSVFAAWNPTELKIWIVSLPLIAGLFTTILSQWNVKENWQLRESARIQVARLIAEARILDETDRNALDREALRLRTALFDIEAEQSRGFFSAGQPPKKEEAATA